MGEFSYGVVECNITENKFKCPLLLCSPHSRRNDCLLCQGADHVQMVALCQSDETQKSYHYEVLTVDEIKKIKWADGHWITVELTKDILLTLALGRCLSYKGNIILLKPGGSIIGS